MQAAMQGDPIIGEVIFEGYTTFYSPWFPRGGDDAVFILETFDISGLTLTWTFWTKNAEDTDASATQVGSAETITAAGLKETSLLSGFKELVRYKFSTGATPSMDWVHFRVLNPSWQYN